MFLHGVVQSRLVLDVLCVDVRPVFDQVLNKLRGLDTVDEASASKVIGQLNIGSGFNQCTDNLHVTEMREEGLLHSN